MMDIKTKLNKFNEQLKQAGVYIKQKEIRKPLTKNNIKNNWAMIGAQKEIEMSQIYYSRMIEDGEIMAMIETLPFTKITKI